MHLRWNPTDTAFSLTVQERSLKEDCALHAIERNVKALDYCPGCFTMYRAIHFNLSAAIYGMSKEKD